jgi:hypothetical protein
MKAWFKEVVLDFTKKGYYTDLTGGNGGKG